MNERLWNILKTMDVPQERMSDPAWMLRNLRVRNGAHPDLEEALFLLSGTTMSARRRSQETA